MLKRILVLIICSFNFSAFALSSAQLTTSNCAQALPANNPGFCSSFKSIAFCHCIEARLPPGMCQDVTAIYNRMLALFTHSLQKACQYAAQQHPETSAQMCMDDWNCYFFGGRDSTGSLCSGTGRRCG